MQDLLSQNIIPTLAILIITFVLFLAFKKPRAGSPFQTKPNFRSKTTVRGFPNTPTLNMFSTDFTLSAQQNNIDPVIGREDEIRKLTRVLVRRRKNNAILVGHPGVGKTAIAEGLAVRIVAGKVPDELQNKKLIALNVANLMSDTKYRGEFEKRIRKILDEIKSTDRSVILFIDEIHSIIQSHGTEGSVNFADILKPYLARGDLQMIGATTIEEYEKYIKPNPSLGRRFQPIEVKEPTKKETLEILNGVKDKYREYHKVEFTNAALETATELSANKIKERNLPDKAIDAIDEAAAMIKVSHLHESIPPILYQAAVQAHPDIAEIWKKIQKIDGEILESKDKKKIAKLTQEREMLEEKISKKGIITIDSSDVEKIIEEWSHDINNT